MITQKHQEVYDNIAEISQNDSELFIFHLRITGTTRNDQNTKNVEIALPLRYLLK